METRDTASTTQFEGMVDDWRAALPNLAAYVDQLPDGLKSYPDCRVARELVDGLLARAALEPAFELPPLLHALTALGASRADWIPEALYIALVLAVADRRGHEVNASIDTLVESSAPLLGLCGPADVTNLDGVIRANRAAWTRMHQGTSETPLHNGPGWSATAFSYPTRLVPSSLLEQMARLAAASLTRAHVPSVTVDFRTEADPRTLGRSIAVFTRRWDAESAQRSVDGAAWRTARSESPSARASALSA